MAPSTDPSPSLSPALTSAAWGLLAVWLVLVCWFPVANLDIWVHLAVGRDIVAGGGFPVTDVYSWTAAGRPFTAHEWLAGVLFHLVGTPTAGVGLTVLRAWFVLLLLIALWLALPRDARRSPVVVPLLVVTFVLVFPRAIVRPHLFSLLFAGALVAGFSWWRVHRGYLSLLWTAPLTALWANLHGAYLLAPVLLAGLGVGVLLSARWPALSPADEARPYRARDAAPPFVLAIVCLLAAALTPYGSDLFTFSTEMAGGNAYIKEIVVEWQPSFSSEARRLPWSWIFLGYALLVTAGVALTRRAVSLPELMFAVITAWMAVRAIRFQPYFALFALPVATRAFSTLWRERAGPAVWRAGPAVALLVPALLLAHVAVTGPSPWPTIRQPFQAGFVRHRAADAALRLHELGYEGGVFNLYEDGTYLIYAGRGRFRPVMDGRIDIYGEKLTEAWKTALRDAGHLVLYLDHFRVNAVLLFDDYPGLDDVRARLRETGTWREEAHDGWVLFLRDPPLPT